MKKCLVVMLYVAIFGSVATIAQGKPDMIADTPSIQAELEELQKVYSTEIIMGAPMEVNELKIIPLAIAGFGFGQHGMQGDGKKVQGKMSCAGGVMIPVGVLVVSDKKIQLLQLSKGFVEQLGSALAPIIVQTLTRRPAKEGEEEIQVKEPEAEGINVTQILSNFRGFLKTMRIVLTILFLLGWLALALIIETFLPQQVTAIASTLQKSFWRTVLIGIVSFIAVVLLAVVLTISLIGIPLTFVVIVLTCALTLFGSVGLALLVGQKIVRAFKQVQYPDVLFVLIGVIILGILGIIPIPLLKLIVGLVVGILGFGSVLLLQWENVRKKEA